MSFWGPPFLWETGVNSVEVDLPLIMELEVSIAEHTHEDAGAHVVNTRFGGAHGDLDLVAGLLVWVLGDVCFEKNT